jgi:hypothetical protein
MVGCVAILIDPPNWPAHGTLFSHLVSDVSVVELHAFAAHHDLPGRAFDRDHYDVPVARYAGLVASGATEVSSRELLARLLASGLRRRKVPAEDVPRPRGCHDGGASLDRSASATIGPTLTTTPRTTSR